MKRKKWLLYIAYYMIGAIVLVIIYLNSEKKYDISRQFRSIIHSAKAHEGDSIYSYCDTLTLFIQKHPLDKSFDLACDYYKTNPSTINEDALRSNFINVLYCIDDEYSKQSRKAQRQGFIAIAILPFLLSFARKMINKKDKDKSTE